MHAMEGPSTGTVRVPDQAPGPGTEVFAPPERSPVPRRPSPSATRSAPTPTVDTVDTVDTVTRRRDRPGRVDVAAKVAVATVLVVAVVLRFWTTSDLWLDEALTVNIARLPVHEIPTYLRRDGAPPLYYVLLHFWMGIFGTSDLAVRSLSGVLGLATLPLVWLAGRRLGGPVAAWAATLLVATSPFAVRYDTETRMYALVTFLTVVGFLALDRTLRRPRPGNLVAVGTVTALLLYSHYWSLYLVGVTMVWLAWLWFRGSPARRRGAGAALGAAAVGCLTFVPWLPIFLFQSQHTGTPWASPATFGAAVGVLSSFAGGGSGAGRVLAFSYVVLGLLGLFAAAVDRRHIDLDLRTRRRGRGLAIVTVGTVAVAVLGGSLSHSGFIARYASVVFVPLLLLAALGVTAFRDRWVRAGILTVAVVAGLAGAIPNVTTNRTQAGQVAAELATHGRTGDVVAYCPDQLGPSVARLLPDGRYAQVTFPRGTGPEFVDWVDYEAASAAGSAPEFARKLEAAAGSDHRIFLVWAPGYQTFGGKCGTILHDLSTDPTLRTRTLVTLDPGRFYQPMSLTQFAPRTP